ncbi:hypothetical protein pipiens_020221, partial [Culex pipiens pipiens]
MAVLQRMAQEAEESMDTSNSKLAVKRSANSSTNGEENGGEDGFKPVIPKGKRSKKSKKKTPLSTIETRATAKGSVRKQHNLTFFKPRGIGHGLGFGFGFGLGFELGFGLGLGLGFGLGYVRTVLK